MTAQLATKGKTLAANEQQSKSLKRSLPTTVSSLARPWNLPTVWSNCLAGWWLGGGGGRLPELVLLFGGATLLYLGGAFLNDTFDLDYDRLSDPQRPIPSGMISQQAVWRWGVALLVVGSLLLFWCGPVTGALGLALASFIILFDAAHRLTPVSPLFMGWCRFLLYLLAASVSDRGVTGWSIWCGLTMAVYVTGVGCLTAWHEKPNRSRPWPVILLAVPVAFALIMDVGRYRESGLLLSAVLVLWTLRSLRQTFWSLEPNFQRTLAGLQAGIVFVDWLATCPANFVDRSNSVTRNISVAFLVLFGLTLLAQRLFRSQNR